MHISFVQQLRPDHIKSSLTGTKRWISFHRSKRIYVSPQNTLPRDQVWDSLETLVDAYELQSRLVFAQPMF